MKTVIIFLILSCPVFAQTYTTNFPIVENPISENGNWLNGGLAGSNNVQVSPAGIAHGVYTDHLPQYRDPNAILTGSWSPNQTVQATVYCNNPNPSYYQEVELHLRRTIVAGSPGTQTGYEINWACRGSAGNYSGVASWDGALGAFTSLDGGAFQGNQYSVVTGDIVKASIVGSTISVFKNGTQLYTITNNKWVSGSPGMGFNYGLQNTAVDVGFTSFTATANGTPPDTTPPRIPTTLQVQ